MSIQDNLLLGTALIVYIVGLILLVIGFIVSIPALLIGWLTLQVDRLGTFLLQKTTSYKRLLNEKDPLTSWWKISNENSSSKGVQ
jgi:hypothetical protein